MKTLLTAAALAAMVAAPASATFISLVDEDFESYADTAELGGTWALSDATLDTGLGNPGQSMFHPGTAGSFSGGNTNTFSFPDTLPGPNQTLIFEAQIYDDGTSANERNTAGLRGAGSANIIEMGHYNSPSHYAIRTVLFAGGSSNWAAFTDLVDDSGAQVANTPVEGWHTYTAEITATSVDFSLDLNSDGNVNATLSVPAVANPAGWNVVRLGGPSDLSAAGGGVNFDNVSVTLVPEPASALLCLLPAAWAATRRRV
ncbi:MAG: hypothetical protein AAGJ46_06860 [Planctomycetota bacterium]